MNAGYVRLSRDDDKRNYVSIENQKLIINSMQQLMVWLLTAGMKIDGIYRLIIFDRPGFQQMMMDMDKDIDTVYVKDFSRLVDIMQRFFCFWTNFRNAENIWW